MLLIYMWLSYLHSTYKVLKREILDLDFQVVLVELVHTLYVDIVVQLEFFSYNRQKRSSILRKVALYSRNVLR